MALLLTTFIDGYIFFPQQILASKHFFTLTLWNFQQFKLIVDMLDNYETYFFGF